MNGAVETNKGRQDHRKMIASGSQKELRSIGSISRIENHYARSKNRRNDMSFEVCVGNEYGLTSCTKLKVE